MVEPMRKIILKSKIEQSFDTIREEFARVEEERDKALGKVAAWNKDTEIQKLTGQIGRLREEMSRGLTHRRSNGLQQGNGRRRTFASFTRDLPEQRRPGNMKRNQPAFHTAFPIRNWVGLAQ